MLDTQSTAPTLDELRARRPEIMAIAVKHGVRSLLVIGSVARGQARDNNDVDFLIELESDRTVLDLSRLILDLIEALGRDVHVVEVDRIWRSRQQILAEAVAL